MYFDLASDAGQFLGGYFHQDWTYDHDSWEDVVDEYVDEVSSECVHSTGAQIQAMLDGMSDEELEDVVWRRLACFYNPPTESLRTWLSRVVQRIEHRHGSK
jgi:hypothetical protein